MKKKRILLIPFLILIILILIWKLNIFSIDKIEVSSNAECATNDDLQNEVNTIGINWFDLQSDKIKNKLKPKYLCIKEVNLSYQFPKTIKIVVYGRNFLTKVFQLDQTLNLPEIEASSSSETALLDWSFPAESSEDALVVDDTGYIFTKKPQNFPLPILYLSENLILGKQMDTNRFNLIGQVFGKYPQINKISSQSIINAKIFGNTLLINDTPRVVFSLEKDILKQLASLQLILQKAKIDQRSVEIIDLRFDKPVIQYQPKTSK